MAGEPMRRPDPGPQHELYWHLDKCHNVVFTPAIRAEQDYPMPGGPGAKGFEPGFDEMRSTRPIRAVEIYDSENAEVCAFHYGKMTDGVDGFARPIFCSLPYRLQVSTFSQTSTLRPFCNTTFDTTWQGIEPGFDGFLGVYHAPWWTEAIYHSDIVKCGDILE